MAASQRVSEIRCLRFYQPGHPLIAFSSLSATVHQNFQKSPHPCLKSDMSCQTKLKGSTDWINAKWGIVRPLLESGTFLEQGYRFDPRRVHALQGVINLLSRPHQIHLNLRHGSRAPGKIRGTHIYVREMSKNEVWVAFTLYDDRLKLTIVTSSFYTNKTWLADCASLPAIYLRQASK